MPRAATQLLFCKYFTGDVGTGIRATCLQKKMIYERTFMFIFRIFASYHIKFSAYGKITN